MGGVPKLANRQRSSGTERVLLRPDGDVCLCAAVASALPPDAYAVRDHAPARPPRLVLGSVTEAAATRRVAANTAALVMADVAAKGSLFVLYAIIARTLGEPGFGDYTLVVSLAFFVRVAALGTDLILSREVARSIDNVHGLFWDTILLKGGAGTLLLGGMVGFAAAAGYPAVVVGSVALVGLSNLIDVLAFSLHATLQGRERMGPTSIALALESATIAALGSAALLLLGGGLLVLSAIYVIAALLAWGYIAAAARRRGIRPRRHGETSRLRWLVRVAAPTGVSVLFGAALARIDAVILSLITGSSATVGLYGAAYRIFEATMFVSWALGNAVYPILSRLAPRTPALRRVFEVSCLAITAVTGALGGAMALFGPAIVNAVFGSDFAGAGMATRILSGSVVLYGVFIVATMTLLGQDRQRLLPWIAGIPLAVNIGLNVVLIPPLGVNGAALAMTATQALATVMAVTLALRDTGTVSPVRMFAAVSAGLGAMVLVAAAVGSELVALAPAVAAYTVVFLVVEWVLHREDLVLAARALRGRGIVPKAGA